MHRRLILIIHTIIIIIRIRIIPLSIPIRVLSLIRIQRKGILSIRYSIVVAVRQQPTVRRRLILIRHTIIIIIGIAGIPHAIPVRIRLVPIRRQGTVVRYIVRRRIRHSVIIIIGIANIPHAIPVRVPLGRIEDQLAIVRPVAEPVRVIVCSPHREIIHPQIIRAGRPHLHYHIIERTCTMQCNRQNTVPVLDPPNPSFTLARIQRISGTIHSNMKDGRIRIRAVLAYSLMVEARLGPIALGP